MHDDRLTDEEGRLATLRRYEILDTAEEEPFQRVAELIQTFLSVPIAAVTLIDGSRQWFKAAVGSARIELPRDAAFGNETIRQYGALAVFDAQADGRFAALPWVTGAPHIRSYIGVPLTTAEGYNIGTLCAFDTEVRPFDARQARILRKLADIVVEQIELRQIAKHDTMTGALTSRGFTAEVERECNRSARYDRPSSLILLDVDNFKALNERLGHRAGDDVLVAIANSCLATMRKSDTFGRLGGDTFGLLLPETYAEDAGIAAERIRGIIEGTTIETIAGLAKVTISLGIAGMPTTGDTTEWLMDAAASLREAKRLGRNRFTIHEPGRAQPELRIVSVH